MVDCGQDGSKERVKENKLNKCGVATGFTFSMKSVWSWVGTGNQIDYGLSGMGHDGNRNDGLVASTKDDDRSDVMKRGNESRFGIDSGLNYEDGR